MSRFILGAAGAVAWGALLLTPVQQAGAQVTADEHGVSVGSPHETPAETTNQQGNRANQQPNRADQQGFQQQAPDDSGMQQSADRQQRNSDRSNRQWSDRNDSRSSDRDWRSDIRFGERTSEGLTISRVGEGSRYYQSGLRDGDVIISYNGRRLQNEGEFGRWANERSRERVPVIVLRDGERETIYIEHSRGDSRSNVQNTGSYESQAFLGVRFETRFRNGAVISSVVPGGPADEAGLKPGDELVAINGRQVESPREVTRIVGSMQPGDKIDIEFARRTEQQTQAVLEEHPRALASAQYQRGENDNRGIEQSSYDDEGSYGAADEPSQYNSDQGTTERSGERRGGRLLPRLRN